MRRKGFVFTIDALSAIVLIVIMLSLFISYYHAYEGRAQGYDTASEAAADTAVIGFYTNRNAAALGLDSQIPAGSSYAACYNVYIYDPANGDNSAQAAIGSSISERKYCWGAA